MIKTNSFIFRLGTAMAMTGMTTLAIPMAAVGAEAQDAMAKHAKSEADAREKQAKLRPSRPLLGAELRTMRGKGSQNPYLSGSAKWGINIDGVDITTGNLSLSSTDLSFEGGYGIPVNVTRTYSANNGDEGPLGIGWTLSVDLRSTAGGLLKSGGAPVRSVPLAMKERPSDQVRDSVSGIVGVNEPVSAMLGTDAGGTEQTVQRDVDGIMMPPSWDLNVIETEYETVVLDGGEEYQIAKSQTITTPEGTVYTYVKKGEYVRNTGTAGSPVYEAGGLADFRTPSEGNSTREPSNVLKIVSVEDRHGNDTTYTYSTDDITFTKVNGIVREKKLKSISMPGGRGLWFTWGNGTNAPVNRILSVKDFDTGTGRTASYGYGESVSGSAPLSAPSGYLSSATSPGGKLSRYGYYAASVGSLSATVLHIVRDPRGLDTTYHSTIASVNGPSGNAGNGVYTYLAGGPNGMKKRFYFMHNDDTKLGPDPQPTSPPTVLNNVGVAVYDPIAAASGGLISASDYISLTAYDWAQIGSGLPFPSSIDQSPFLFFRATRTTTGGVSSRPAPGTDKIFSAASQNLLWEASYSNYQDNGSVTVLHGTSKTTWYSFRGQPLRELVEEGKPYTSDLGNQSSPDRTLMTDYAYWGRDKYFQQKAVRGPFKVGSTTAANVRYSFTDYYNDQAATGKKGQTHKVYRTGVDSNLSNGFEYIPTGTTEVNITNLSVTAGVGETAWKRTINPVNSAIHAAEFDYDSKGRAISVKKLQKVVSGTPTYVETTTAYGADGGTTWGMPTSVIEDYGSGKINRTTTTEEYDRSGRAKVVTDGNGRKFQTVYDADGLVLYINRWWSGTGYAAQVVNEYTSSGQLQFSTDWTQVTESLIEYGSATDSNVGKRGQVLTVDNAGPNDGYRVSYEYDAFGRRKAMETEWVNTPRRFEYRNYVWVGMPGQEQPVFTKLVEMEKPGSTWIASKEEYRYVFDATGRMISAQFAPSPSRTTRDSTTDSWYTATDPAEYFASADYVYDIGGRLSKLVNNWNDRDGTSSTYIQAQIRAAEYTYSGDYKLRSAFALKDPDNATMFTETYGYDSKLDYLTSASYSDQSSQNGTWTYDAAGNRANSSYTYDNLNRMTASPHGTYTHDAVGNRLSNTGGSTTYVWDEFNRLEQLQDEFAKTSYDYLPNGLRSTKIQEEIGEGYIFSAGSGFYDQEYWQNLPTTRYRYDGQMTLEEDVTYGTSPNVKVDETRYTLGARGIESIVAERISGPNAGGVTTGVEYRSFPLYDGHGNMIATLTRNGTSYTIGAQKRYNVWGSVRTQTQGSAILNPNKAYCANLGHTRDEESSLIYMRARYYEPWTGRFISEDPARDGENWFVYCSNNPVSRADYDGESYLSESELSLMLQQLSRAIDVAGFNAKVVASVALISMLTWLMADKCFGSPNDVEYTRRVSWIRTFQSSVSSNKTVEGSGSVKQRAKGVTQTYAIMLKLAFWILDGDPFWDGGTQLPW